MSAKGYWIAFSIGVAAGAAVALLYAPQTGKSTRKKLRRNFDDAGDTLTDSLKDAGDYLKAQAERLSSEAQTLYSRGKGGLNDALDSASSYAGSAAKQVRSMV